jgi:hypothetical protein
MKRCIPVMIFVLLFILLAPAGIFVSLDLWGQANSFSTKSLRLFMPSATRNLFEKRFPGRRRQKWMADIIS